MGRLIKSLLKFFLYSFIVFLVIGFIGMLFRTEDKDGENEMEVAENTIVPSEFEKALVEEKVIKVVNEDKLSPVKSIEQLNGSWKRGDDILLIDTKKKLIQFNDGLEMKLAYGNMVDEFYVYGEVGSSIILKAKAYISPDKKEIYLERLDGGVSNRYKMYSVSIVDKIFNSLSEEDRKKSFIEIIKLDDKAIYLSEKKYPNANEWEKQIDYQRELEEQYRLRWYIQQSWYETIGRKVDVAFNIRGKIAMYGVKKNWDKLYDKEIRKVDYK